MLLYITTPSYGQNSGTVPRLHLLHVALPESRTSFRTSSHSGARNGFSVHLACTIFRSACWRLAFWFWPDRNLVWSSRGAGPVDPVSRPQTQQARRDQRGSADEVPPAGQPYPTVRILAVAGGRSTGLPRAVRNQFLCISTGQPVARFCTGFVFRPEIL